MAMCIQGLSGHRAQVKFTGRGRSSGRPFYLDAPPNRHLPISGTRPPSLVERADADYFCAIEFRPDDLASTLYTSD